MHSAIRYPAHIPHKTLGYLLCFADMVCASDFPWWLPLRILGLPFSIFMRRFENFLPQLRIVYDNSCNLHKCALSREPTRFSETVLLTNRLHFLDHTSCTLGYITNAKDSDPTIKTVNTQVNEQANSDLHNLSKQVAHDSPKCYFFMLRLSRLNQIVTKNFDIDCCGYCMDNWTFVILNAL